MALDVTQSEAAFNRSVKKYFVDELLTKKEIFIDFDTVYRVPTGVEEWIVFHRDGISVANGLATGKVEVYLFTKNDDENERLAELVDKLMAILVPDEDSDGLKRVPLVDEMFSPVAGMVVSIGVPSAVSIGADGVKYKYVNLYFKFGTK